MPAVTARVWVADCKSVGSGDKALTYLGRYLYKGVIREKDIISIEGEQVTYRYKKSNGSTRLRTLSGEEFLCNYCSTRCLWALDGRETTVFYTTTASG